MRENSFVLEADENGNIQLPPEIIKEWSASLQDQPYIVFSPGEQAGEWELTLCEGEEAYSPA